VDPDWIQFQQSLDSALYPDSVNTVCTRNLGFPYLAQLNSVMNCNCNQNVFVHFSGGTGGWREEKQSHFYGENHPDQASSAQVQVRFNPYGTWVQTFRNRKKAV
jgi:hypothetical protein